MDEKAIGSAVGVGLEGSNSHVQRDPLRYISFSEIYHDRAWHLHGVGFSQDPSFIPKHIVCDPRHRHKSESPRRTSGIKGADDNEKALRQTRRTHRQTTLSMLHNILGWRGRRHIYFLAAFRPLHQVVCWRPPRSPFRRKMTESSSGSTDLLRQVEVCEYRSLCLPFRGEHA